MLGTSEEVSEVSDTDRKKYLLLSHPRDVSCPEKKKILSKLTRAFSI